jgi:predicted small lipoprotein YifL
MRNALLALFAACFICGCGQRGPLYLPSDKPAPKKPAPQPAAKEGEEKRQTQ